MWSRSFSCMDGNSQFWGGEDLHRAQVNGFMCPQDEEKLWTGKAVKTRKCSQNHLIGRFDELNICSLLEKRLRGNFNAICKYLYRSRNLVRELFIR